jgi:hypothetical protein
MLDKGEADKAGELMDKALEKEFGEITWNNEEGLEEEHNGMPMEYWTGHCKEGTIIIMAWIISTPSGKELLCYFAAGTEETEKNEKTIIAIIDSIKPLATVSDDEEEGIDEEVVDEENEDEEDDEEEYDE